MYKDRRQSAPYRDTGSRHPATHKHTLFLAAATFSAFVFSASSAIVINKRPKIDKRGLLSFATW